MTLPNLGAYVADGRWSEVEDLLLSAAAESLGQVDKSTLLCELAYYGQESATRTLLASGADVNFRFELDTRSPFAYKLVAYPRSTPLGQTILGSSYGRFKTLPVMTDLLSAGANPNAPTYQGYTPLQLAIVENRPEHARILLAQGADPHSKCEDPLIDEGDAFYFAEQFAERSSWACELLKK